MSSETAEGNTAQNEEPESDTGIVDSNKDPPKLKSELTDVMHDMGIDSAEDTPEPMDTTEPMDTEDDSHTAQDLRPSIAEVQDLRSGNEEVQDVRSDREDPQDGTSVEDSASVSESKPREGGEETQKEIQPDAPPPSSGEEDPPPSSGETDPLITSSNEQSWEFIDGGVESPPEALQDEGSQTGAEISVEEKHVGDDEKDVGSVTRDKDTDRRPMRRSRSQDDEKGDDNLEEKETMDGRGPKKSKKDKDNREHRHPSRSREPVVVRPNLSKMRTLEDFGYEFNAEGKLQQIKSGSPFVFEVIPNDRSFNQRHYEALGEVITEHVFGLLETDCDLIRLPVPVDTTKHDPSTFIFVSKDVPSILRGEMSTDKKLLVLIHGSGVVRAGQWARRLIINNSLNEGTMIPYINQAKEEDYEVMILNTNYNSDKGRMIKGSSSPESHGKYVWEHYISKWPGHQKIAIVAHSAGGYVTVEMAKSCSGFMQKVLAVGFTDSVHSLGYYTSKDVSNWFIKHSKNWVSSRQLLDTELDSYGRDCDRVSAGTSKHEETSYYSMKSIFQFFSEKETEEETYEDEGDHQDEPPREQHMSRGPEEDVQENEEDEPSANGKSNKLSWCRWLIRLVNPKRLLMSGFLGGLLAGLVWWYVVKYNLINNDFDVNDTVEENILNGSEI